MNVLDASVVQTVYAVDEKLEDKLATVSLGFAQNLYSTDSVDRVRILLKDDTKIIQSKKQLNLFFAKNKLDFEIKTWVELTPFYTKTKKMFEFIFVFIFIIVISVTVMSIINTLSMSILERTQEIGTMRSMGLTPFGVMRIFMLESFLLMFLGSSFGLFFAFCIQGFINLFEVHWIPPQLSMPIPLEIHLDYINLLGVFVILQAIVLLTAFVLTKRATYTSIVDALRHA